MLLQEQFLEFKKRQISEETCEEDREAEAKFQLKWREESQTLIYVSDEEECVVTPKPCFPWSQPLSKISLRCYENNEKAFVAELDELEPGSKHALLWAMKEACFYFSISKIESIKDEFELRVWKVETHQGERVFQTKLTAWPSLVGPNRYIVRDVHKDLYVIEDIESLDANSQNLFWPLSDA